MCSKSQNKVDLVGFWGNALKSIANTFKGIEMAQQLRVQVALLEDQLNVQHPCGS